MTASFLVALLGWYELRPEYVAPAWMLFAFVLALAARRLKLREFSFQRDGLALAASVGAVAFNLVGTAEHAHLALRLVTVAIVFVLLYACSHLERTATEGVKQVAALYTWVATALVATLLWYELPAEYAAPAWAALALILAVVARQIRLRELAYQANCLAAAAFIGALWVNPVSAVGPAHHLVLRQSLIVTLVAALLYGCAWWAKASDVAGAAIIAEAHTWGATLLGGLLTWYECPAEWVPVVWCAMALALVMLSSLWKRRDLAWQANGLSVAALIRLLSFNLGSTGIGHHIPARLVSVAVSAALLYLCARWSSSAEAARKRRIPEAYTWAASTLVSLLVWYEVRPIGVAVAWMLLGLVLFEIGLERKSGSLRLQAYFALTASFVRLFFVNLGEGAPGHIAPSVYTTLPVAIALFYVYWRMKSRPEESVRVVKWRVRAADYYSFVSAPTVAALMRAELRAGWVVAAWAGLLVLLVALAYFEKQAVFLIEALILGAAIACRAALFNFYDRSYFARGFFDGWLAPVAVAIALLFVSLVFAFKLKLPAPMKEGVTGGRLRRVIAGIYRRPEQFFFFVPVGLLTALLKLEFGTGMATLAWGVEAVALFLFALSVDERSYRLTGLALLLVCVGKIITWDVWQLNGSNRYVTLIGVGIALVVVSTLYTRYKEVLRRYL